VLELYQDYFQRIEKTTIIMRLLVVLVVPSLAWYNQELDLFDLVEEEVNRNFYDDMEINQSAALPQQKSEKLTGRWPWSFILTKMILWMLRSSSGSWPPSTRCGMTRQEEKDVQQSAGGGA
jgi:hypothetical protein